MGEIERGRWRDGGTEGRRDGTLLERDNLIYSFTYN
jgi:hypothetical protein